MSKVGLTHQNELSLFFLHHLSFIYLYHLSIHLSFIYLYVYYLFTIYQLSACVSSIHPSFIGVYHLSTHLSFVYLYVYHLLILSLYLPITYSSTYHLPTYPSILPF